MHAPVVIAGGGPVGMTTALLLARHGVASVVLEAEPLATRVGSKAICFQRDVLDVLDRVGVAQPAVAEGVTWRTGRTFYRDLELKVVELPSTGRDALPPFVNLSQSALEGYLMDRVDDEPLVDLRMGCRLVGLSSDDGGVVATVEADNGSAQVEGAWLVGADGARSTVRHAIGASFEGETWDDQFLIADIEADLPFPAERRFHFDPEWNPGRQVLVHQQPRSIWRIDWQVPADFTLEEARASGELDQRIRMIVGAASYRIDWVSVYRFHQRIADPWRHGRVFLAGDAAHLMSPFGARGLNSGIQDAENLAWKLAFVERGWADPGLLDSYAAERVPAARENLRVTGETMRFIAPRTDEERRHRVDTLDRAVDDATARASIDSGVLAEPFWYVDSPLTTPSGDLDGFPVDAGVPRPPVPGVLCPDSPVDGGRLRERFGDGIVLLAFGEDASAVAARCAAEVGATGVGVTTLRLEPRSTAGQALEVDGDCVVVIRPDGHIAARLPLPCVGLVDAVRRCLGHPDACRKSGHPS